MAAIVGTKEAKEISICRHGANQHSHVLITKALDPAPIIKGDPPAPENDDMDFAATKALLAMNDVTKAYALKMDEPALKAFLAKPVDDQAAEAKKAHDEAEAVTKAAADAEAAKAAGETDLAKRLENSEATSAALQKRLDDRDADDEIRKTASGAEFRGYPGGEDTVFSMLKSMRAMPAADREVMVNGMKSTAKAALLAGTEFGVRDEAEFAKAAPATAEFNAAVTAYQTEKSVTKEVAAKHVSEANKALYARALAEAGAL